MNVRQWLGRARSLNREMAALEKAKQDAKDAALRITQNYEADGAQSSKDPHKLDKLVEYIDLLDKKNDELIDAKLEITEAISGLPDSRHRTLLYEYYINGLTWEEVAAKMHYTWRWTMRLRKEALVEIEKSHINSYSPCDIT